MLGARSPSCPLGRAIVDVGTQVLLLRWRQVFRSRSSPKLPRTPKAIYVNFVGPARTCFREIGLWSLGSSRRSYRHSR